MLPSRLAEDPLAIARASHFVRARTSDEHWLDIDSTMLDEIVSHPLPSPSQQLNNLLDWMKTQAGEHHFAEIDISDTYALSAVIGAADVGGVKQLIGHAEAKGLVTTSEDGTLLSMTASGWEVAEPETPLRADDPAVDQKAQVPEPAQMVVKATCPLCGPDRFAKVVASHSQAGDDQDAYLSVTINTLRCEGCGTPYVQKQTFWAEDEEFAVDLETGASETTVPPRIAYWPAPARRPRPQWLESLSDEPLLSLLDEVYSALDADHRVLAAIGTRTAIDRALELNGADAAATFAEKIKSLFDNGTIGQKEEETLSVLTDAGSAAAHRGWRPSRELLYKVVVGMEAFLNRTLIVHKTVDGIKGDVPMKEKRRRKKRP
jgi:hypothetical protein